jgi:hypothetical protein
MASRRQRREWRERRSIWHNEEKAQEARRWRSVCTLFGDAFSAFQE